MPRKLSGVSPPSFGRTRGRGSEMADTMSTAGLKRLHEAATVARDAAHRAYTKALANRKGPGDTDDAYEALIKSNEVRDRIYDKMLDSIGYSASAEVNAEAVRELRKLADRYLAEPTRDQAERLADVVSWITKL
jgi:succinate dehydrogenase/fumarate reductase flavoprotein subunit